MARRSRCVAEAATHLEKNLEAAAKMETTASGLLHAAIHPVTLLIMCRSCHSDGDRTKSFHSTEAERNIVSCLISLMSRVFQVHFDELFSLPGCQIIDM